MQKFVAGSVGLVVTITLAILGVASPADAGPWPGDTNTGGFASYGTGTVSYLDQNNPDYTGIGNGVELPEIFENPNWGRMPRSAGLNYSRWTRPNFQINCLPATTPKMAWQVVYTYVDTRDLQTQVYGGISATNRGKIRDTLRALSSMFAASTDGIAYRNPSGTTKGAKGRSREPRFITTVPATGACEPIIHFQAVPAAVYRAHPVQTHENGVEKPGMYAYLRDQGWGGANRNVLVMSDANGVTGDYYGSDGTYSTATNPAFGGEFEDFPATDPAESNINWGGMFASQVFSGNGDGHFNVNHGTGGMAASLSHAMGHSLGMDLDNPAMNCCGHIKPAWDVMGETNINGLGQTCNPYPGLFDVEDPLTEPDNQKLAYMRFDCNHDDYWAREGDGLIRPWGQTQYSMSEQASLWGGNQPSVYHDNDIRDGRHDFCIRGPQDPNYDLCYAS